MIRVAEQTACDQPMVSVALITYNHEQFIAQAIESVLMQETGRHAANRASVYRKISQRDPRPPAGNKPGHGQELRSGAAGLPGKIHCLAGRGRLLADAAKIAKAGGLNGGKPPLFDVWDQDPIRYDFKRWRRKRCRSAGTGRAQAGI